MTQRSLQLNEKKKKKRKCAQVLEQVCTRCDAMGWDVMGCDAFVRSWHNLQICCMYKGIATKPDLCSKSCVRKQQKRKQRGKNRQSSWEGGRVKSRMRGQDPEFGGRGPGGPDRHLVKHQKFRGQQSLGVGHGTNFLLLGEKLSNIYSISILLLLLFLFFSLFLGFILGVLSLVLWVVVPISLFFIYLPIFCCTFWC